MSPIWALCPAARKPGCRGSRRHTSTPAGVWDVLQQHLHNACGAANTQAPPSPPESLAKSGQTGAKTSESNAHVKMHIEHACPKISLLTISRFAEVWEQGHGVLASKKKEQKKHAVVGVRTGDHCNRLAKSSTPGSVRYARCPPATSLTWVIISLNKKSI